MEVEKFGGRKPGGQPVISSFPPTPGYRHRHWDQNQADGQTGSRPMHRNEEDWFVLDSGPSRATTVEPITRTSSLPGRLASRRVLLGIWFDLHERLLCFIAAVFRPGINFEMIDRHYVGTKRTWSRAHLPGSTGWRWASSWRANGTAPTLLACFSNRVIEAHT